MIRHALGGAVAQPPDTAKWRLICGDRLDGPWNMAVDEALLESVIAGGEPVLRLYTWAPATLSVGVNQPIREIDRDACEAHGFGLVRRITGGRAVLHQHELTYSVIAQENDPRVSGGVLESYRKISAALVDGLRALGVEVSLSLFDRDLHRTLAAERRQRDLGLGDALEVEGGHGAVCFEATSAYEITAGGKKLVGSAQARRGGAILQHGSILLDIDWEAWASAFTYASEAGRERALGKLPSRMTSMKQELGRDISPAELAETLASSFERRLKIGLAAAPLRDDEYQVARRLAKEKYSGGEWTGRI